MNRKLKRIKFGLKFKLKLEQSGADVDVLFLLRQKQSSRGWQRPVERHYSVSICCWRRRSRSTASQELGAIPEITEYVRRRAQMSEIQPDIRSLRSNINVRSTSLVPSLGVNYPNWVMGRLIWVMGCFFCYWCFNHNTFY